MDAVTKYKMLIVEYLLNNLGKNPSIFFIYKMAKMLNTDEIFNHILKKTTLFKNVIENE